MRFIIVNKIKLIGLFKSNLLGFPELIFLAFLNVLN